MRTLNSRQTVVYSNGVSNESDKVPKNALRNLQHQNKGDTIAHIVCPSDNFLFNCTGYCIVTRNFILGNRFIEFCKAPRGKVFPRGALSDQSIRTQCRVSSLKQTRARLPLSPSALTFRSFRGRAPNTLPPPLLPPKRRARTAEFRSPT